MASSAPKGVRIGILLALALPQLLIGTWAVAAPRNWFERFPGFDPRLVAAEPPFNAHLATDTGSGFLATGIALAVAAVWGHRVAVQMALVTFAAFAVPHVLYHGLQPAPGLTGAEDVVNVLMLASGPALAAVFAWWTSAGTPASQDADPPLVRADRSSGGARRATADA